MLDTFLLRDQRRTQVDAALVRLEVTIPDLQARRDVLAADPNHVPADLQQLDQQLLDQQTWRTVLLTERKKLDSSDWTVADATFHFVFLDWIWLAGLAIRTQVAADPALLATAAPPKFTPQFEQALVNVNLGAGAAPGNLMTLILTAAGGDQGQVDELQLTAHRLWLAGGAAASPYDHVCTLLPMRIETLFRDGNNGPELWIRVIPDEPSISRQRLLVTSIEATFLQEFWNKVRQGIADPAPPVAKWLETPKAATEWATLCSRVGAPRAAWLLTTFLPAVAGGQAVITIPEANRGTPDQEKQQADSVVALPTAIEVWAINSEGGAAVRRRLGVLQPAGADPVSATRSAADLRLPLPDSTQGSAAFSKHWLTDFDQAIKVGLGAKLPLLPVITRDSIQALFVIGQTDEAPADLFQAHANAGTLGLVRLGAATNTVHGSPAAPLDKDADAWLNVVHHRLGNAAPDPKFDARQSAFNRVSQALVGADVVLPFCPVPAGGDLDPVDDVVESQRFAQALWPVLWGHFLRDHLRLLPGGPNVNVNDFWKWSEVFLWPEGPLAPVRIHDQPYGLLPVTTLAGWSGSDADDARFDALERMLADGLTRVRDELVRHAQPPTTVGANTQGLLDVLGRDAVTHKYLFRHWMRFGFFTTFFNSAILPDGVGPDGAWKNMFQVPIGSFRPRTDTPHLALGWEYLDLPLIAATRRPIGLKIDKIFATLSSGITWANFAVETMGRIVPDSLCIRLMIESLMLAQAWQGQEKPPAAVEQLINKLAWPSDDSKKQTQRLRSKSIAGATSLDDLTKGMITASLELGKTLDAQLVEAPDPFSDQGQKIWRMEIPADRLAQLERAFRATLDTAAHRVDPWIIGLAWRRLDKFSSSPRRRYATGVYGWVDGPFHGDPGPTPAGLLHAPSHAQAITSIVLRDKFLSSQAAGAQARGKNVWEMNIDSAVARKALEVAEECRLGFHLFEVIGRQVETIINDFQRIRTLRELRPQHPDRPDIMVVCHGCDALLALVSTTALPEPALEQIRLALTPDQMKQLQLLQASLDGYGDLSVADAVYHLVTAQPHRAAEAMDGASGFGHPPTLDSIRTPPSGYRIQTTVVSVIPWVDPPADPQQSPPGRIAEPSLAAYLAAQYSQPAAYVWKVFTKATGNTPAQQIGSVPLSDLSWSLSDVALLPQVMLSEIVCAKLNRDNRAEALEIVPPNEYFACRQMWGALGQRPVGEDNLQTASDLGLRGRQPSATQIQELSNNRFTKLRAALSGLADRAATIASNPAGVDAGAARKCLQDTFLWGIFPTLDSGQRSDMCSFVFAGGPAPADKLQTWLSAARASVLDRLGRTDAVPLQTLPLLAKQIAELASSEGKLSILAKWGKADLLSATSLHIAAPNATLDTQWLTITAAVRPALARLESLQLQGELKGTHTPLKSWTSGEPADPWQQGFVKPRIISQMGDHPADFRMKESPPHLFAGYGPANAWQGTDVAVGLIDEFGESIPVQERHTYAALGFNAPASRPQQAILLAVPPQPRTPLTNEVLLQILVETRDLTRARAVRPEDLQDGHGLISSMWFQASGADCVRLGPDTQYWK